MKYIVTAIEEQVIKKGEREGEPYFVVSAKEDDPMVTRTIKFPVMPTDEAGINWWKETVADPSRLKTVSVGRYLVGDPSVNSNDTPLPQFRLRKNGSDEFGPVSTSMTVHVLLDKEGKPRVSPRKEALRIIKNIGEFVGEAPTPEPQASNNQPPI